MAAKRKYPVGIQSFEKIRKEGYLYIVEALEQIDRKGYAVKYLQDGRPVTKIGISFSSQERNITEWKAVAL